MAREPGTGTGAVVVTAAANTGGPRSGTVTIAGQTFSATQGAGACGALDVTSQAPPSPGPFIPYVFGLNQKITVTNRSPGFIAGPVYLVLIGEPTHYGDYRDTFLGVNPGTTTCFSTLGDYLIPVAGGGLAPNQTVSIGLNWKGKFYPNYSAKVLSGTPSH